MTQHTCTHGMCRLNFVSYQAVFQNDYFALSPAVYEESSSCSALSIVRFLKKHSNKYIGTSQVVQWQRICLPTKETQETWVWSLSGEEPLQKEMATHSSILAWRIPWTEEPSRLQSMGSQRVGHYWANECSHAHTHTHTHTHTYIYIFIHQFQVA